VEGPLEGLSGPELNAVMGWLGVNGVAFPAPEGGEGAYRCYGEEHGRILYMDTGEVRLRRDPMEVMLRGLSAPWGIGPGTFGDFTRRMALGLPLDDDWDEDDE
jgi:hypothetical protein